MKRIALLVGLAALLLGAPPVPARESQLLVDPAWLHARLGDRDLRLLDMVTEAGDYRKGHIPGAVHLDLAELGSSVAGCDNVLLPPAEFSGLNVKSPIGRLCASLLRS